MIDIGHPEIYYDPQTKQYYYIGDTLICDKCKKPIENIMVLSISWLKHDSIFNVYCINDIQEAKGIGFINEMKVINITDERPATAYRYFMRIPSLVAYKGDSVWSAVKRGNSGVKIIDKTRLALSTDPNYDKVRKEIEHKKKQLEMIDNQVIHNEDEFDAAMDDIVNSVPAIDHDEKILLGADK